MSVKAWFTISAAVLVVLATAFAYRFFVPTPVRPPDIIARAGGVRLKGQVQSFCWPARNGEGECHFPRPRGPVYDQEIPSKGTFTFVVAYPTQPSAGRIDVSSRPDGRQVLVVLKWQDVSYDLKAGRYKLSASARYRNDVWVSYDFLVTVTRPGS